MALARCTSVWTEVIFSRDDLAQLVGQALPLEIDVGAADADHSLSLTDLGDVSLVAGTGLRVACKARVHWPLLGIDVPVEVSSLVVLLIPTIEPGEEGDVLVFRASVEHAAFAALPALLDERITAAVNAKLAAKGGELSWNFSRALDYVVPLPSRLHPLESFAIRPAWGKLRITDEGIVLAASFHSALVRRGEPAPIRVAPPALPGPVCPPDQGLVRSKRLFMAGAFALAGGAAYLLARRALRSRWFG